MAKKSVASASGIGWNEMKRASCLFVKLAIASIEQGQWLRMISPIAGLSCRSASVSRTRLAASARVLSSPGR